jgi:hypothetical protein
MNWRLFFIGIIGMGFGAILAQPAWSYDEIKVTNGGSIQGTVLIEGGKPRPMAFNLVTIPDPVFCGTISTGTGWRIVEDFIIGPNNTLKDVVVMLKGVTKGKTFSLPKVRIESIDCEFLPFVNVIKDKDEIEVVNMDPVEHDIQGYETARERGARVLFNRPGQTHGGENSFTKRTECVCDAMRISSLYVFLGVSGRESLFFHYQRRWKISYRGYPAWGVCVGGLASRCQNVRGTNGEGQTQQCDSCTVYIPVSARSAERA